ncbi:hypothetical protein HD806DRAFT_549600 [Xylariaceae sp. AK1471]|nr:hypothetical protein HD806DRAFT_549600 [Xylariaceae sp. AK1471]
MATPCSSQFLGAQLGSNSSLEQHAFLQPNISREITTYEDTSHETDSGRFAPKEQRYWSKSGDQSWRPLWVRRRVLSMFAAWLAILIAIVQILRSVSEKHNGVSDSRENFLYVWKFGPTAILVITAAFWARVEYQSNRSMPWVELSKGPSPAQTTIELDYNSMFLPVLLAASVRNRHYLVAIVAVIGLALKVLIALSSSLLLLQPGTAVNHSGSLPLMDSFLTRVPLFNNSNINYEPYRTFLGIAHLNLTAPLGYSPKVAYQTFASTYTGVNDSSSAIFQAIWSELTCEESSVSIPSGQNLSSGENPTTSMSLKSNFCQNTINTELDASTEWSLGDRFYIIDGYFSPGGGSMCQGAAGPVFTLGYAWFVGSTPTSDNLRQSMVLFCKPSYYVGNAKVTTNEGYLPTSYRSGGGGCPDKHGFINPLVYISNCSWSPILYGRPRNDIPFEIDYGHLLLGYPMPTDWRNLTFQSTAAALREFYQTFDPIVAHFILRQSGNGTDTVEGVVSELRSRLLVKPVVAYAMSGVLGLSIVAIATTAALCTPSTSFVPHEPGKLAGMICNLSNSTVFLKALSNLDETFAILGSYITSAGGTCNKNRGIDTRSRPFELLSLGLTNKTHAESYETKHVVHDPIVLRLVSQSAMLLILIGVLSSLEILFHISNSSKGIGNIGSNAYIHYTWTIVPTLTMVGVGAYFAFSDKEVRGIVPFSSLNAETPFWIINTDFSNRTAAEALYLSLRKRQWLILVTTSTSILVSFLTIFSATLFSVVQVPVQHAVELQQDEWFASFGWPNRQDYTGLVLSNVDNFTYPYWTYENLVLPMLSIPRPPEVISHNMTITAIVPALRPGTNCTRHDMSMTNFTYDGNSTRSLQIELLPHTNSGGSWKSSCGVFWRPYCRELVQQSEIKQFPPCFDATPRRYFFDAGINVTDCSTSQFIWGSFNNTARNWDFLASYSCEDYVDELDVELTLLWPSLTIDKKTPPRPIMQTVRRAARFSPPGDMIHSSPFLEDSDFLNRFVDLSGPRYRLPIETIGDPAKEKIAFAAQQDHWILMMTQLLSGTVRRYNNETAYSPLDMMNEIEKDLYGSPWSGRPFNGPFEPPTAPPSIPGTATDYTVYRVVQNDTSTYFLEALLITVLLLHTATIWLVPRKAVPSNPGTILGVASLLANSNIFTKFEDADLSLALRDRRFKLEWIENETGKTRCTLQVMD